MLPRVDAQPGSRSEPLGACRGPAPLSLLYDSAGEIAGAGVASVMSALADKAIVKKELLYDVAGRDKYQVNNKHDDKYPPLPPSKIVQRAEERVGQEVLYKLTSENCEHFVNELRYGVSRSDQVRPPSVFLSPGTRPSPQPTLAGHQCGPGQSGDRDEISETESLPSGGGTIGVGTRVGRPASRQCRPAWLPGDGQNHVNHSHHVIFQLLSPPWLPFPGLDPYHSPRGGFHHSHLTDGETEAHSA